MYCICLPLYFLHSVPVETLSIVDCTTSTSELCKDKDKVTNSLICEASDFWPSVKLQWMQISENGSTVVPTNTSMTFDTTSLLYSSSSVLEYIPELFSYQYFTCVAIGNAAYKVANKSMTMKGDLPVHEIPRKDVYVMKGIDLTLYCPHDNLPFGQLQVQRRDGTEKVIRVFNSHCPNDGSCEEIESRVTTIENVNNGDDGLYQCISSNGVSATKNDTDVTTVSKFLQNTYMSYHSYTCSFWNRNESCWFHFSFNIFSMVYFETQHFCLIT